MARKKTPKPPVDPDDDELEWLRESHADALDHTVKLIDEIAELRLENARLVEEVASLRQQIESQRGMPPKERPLEVSTPVQSSPPLPTPAPQKFAAANNSSPAPPSLAPAASPKVVQLAPPTKEQLALYRALFRGRDDVYAKRYESAKTGKSGYSPACAREWDDRFCTKKIKKKCTECVFSPMTDEVIAAHMAGRNAKGDFVAGVYPMLSDDTCWFLAADFDGDEWQRDATAYLKTCRDCQIPAYLERSRSGNGGHIWIFFEIPVLASIARKLGAAILTKTMEKRHEISFTTYDRFFPNQDTMPRGGFGNLIALPLNGKSARAGNSLFLDGNMQPHADQWAFLQSIRRVPIDHVEELADAAEREGAVVGVRLSLTDDEQADPWTQPPSKKRPEKRIPGVLPESVKIVQGNMLFLEKAGISSPFLNRLKRLAAFQNPEFYKQQAMRLPTYKTPRVIGCADDFDRHVGLPRGLLGELREVLVEHRVGLELIDERLQGKPLDLQFNGELREEQATAVKELAKHDIGVLSATTAFGKTVIGAWMIAARKTNTLILVHRQELLDQWRERLATFLSIDKKSIGQIGGGKKKPNGFLDIGMIQSLYNKGEVKDVVADYGQVIVDECHHIGAVSFEAVIKQVKARYVLGLTATPTRKDGHHPIIIMQCGPIRYRVNPKKQAAERPFDHVVFPRRTAIPKPTIEMNYQELCSVLAADSERNDFIVADITAVLAEGRNPLVLTERKEHVDTIAARLTGCADHLITMYGGRTKKERNACIERLRAIPKGESRILVATGKYIGEGFDDPRLDTLFLALPVSWKGTIQQYSGRLHRLYESKLEVRVYDYVDTNVPMAWSMFDKRKKGYRAIGYEIGPFE